MRKLHALVLSGDGINCEIETAHAARDAGFATETVHVNDFLKTEGKRLADTQLLLVPGGFSFGDELGSGKILALKLKHGVGPTLDSYVARGGAILGICNGFQVLARLGVFGSVVLAQNEGGHFLNRWVGLELTGHDIFTAGLKRAGVTKLELPIRHGEGRVVLGGSDDKAQALMPGVEIAFRYDEDVNGAWQRAAGLSAYRGRVVGLMPHPEAFWAEELHPWGPHRHVPLGVELFRSAFEQLSQEKSV